ncbi:Lipopolysaccharide export system permease protein LptF [Olavius algarvensis Delta 1 endosymbiont]|nr:Lipopolysaccharide export system permease protein LptF [Olavius algarvensis Delta 1 endosymbiont]
MKLNTITNSYIVKEMLAPFSINLLVFTFLFLMTEMIEITDWIVNYNLNLFTVFKIIFFTLPWFLMFIIPMSVMMAVLLTFLRMSNDNEIVALKSCGLSVYRLLPPVLAFALFGCMLTAFITLYGVPQSKTALEKMAIQLAASHADIGLKERTFNDAFDDVMLYVNKIDTQNKKLIDIFIEDKRQKDIVSTVIAPEGRLFSEPENFTFHLLLSNGTIHQTNPKDRSATSIQFDTYKLSLDFNKEIESYDESDKHREAMSISELRQYMENRAGKEGKDQDYYKAKIVMHRRFSIPIACLAMGLIAFPLGIQSKNAKRSFGLVLCLFFFLLYYLLLTIGYGFGEDGIYPPEIGMWVPNVVMGGIGLFMLIQTGRERSLMIDFFARRLQRLAALINPFRRAS